MIVSVLENLGSALGIQMQQKMVSNSAKSKVADDPPCLIADVVALLGGKRTWKRPPTTQLEMHDAILNGISSHALVSIRDNLKSVPIQTLAKALGVSPRNLGCRANTKRLNPNQGSRLWRLADIMAAAIHLQGSREEAERWLSMPAMALDQRTPLELMTTPVGAEMVKDLIVRLKFGVYT